MHRLVTTSLVLLAAALSITPVYSQIDHDAANNVYFITGDATISTDFSGNEIFVGKDNYANFATLPGTITLNVTDDALITGWSYRQLPDNNYYFGLNVVGTHLVNISGGIVGNAYSFDNSTINFTGGAAIGLQAFNNSNATISGGTLFGTVDGYGTSTVHISGGTTAGAFVQENSSFTITGGAVPKLLAYGGTTTVSGGLFTQAAVANAGQVTFNGSGLTATSLGAGTYFDGVSNLIGTNYTLTGTLTNGDTLNIPIFAGNTVTGDATQRIFSGGAVAEDLYLLTDTTVNTVVNRVTVGRDISNTTNTSPMVALTNAANTGHVEVYNNSIVNVSGATINGGVSASDNSTVNISGGTVESAWGDTNSTVNISGGTVKAAHSLNGNSTNISGGLVQNINGFNSEINISGGTTVILSNGGTSTTNISGGTVQDAYSYDKNITNIAGGSVNRLLSDGTSIVNISGGTVDEMTGSQNSIVNVTGGTVPFLTVLENNTTNLAGGNIGGLDGNTTDLDYTGIYTVGGTFNLYGSNFTRTNITEGMFRGFQGTYSTLLGTLLDGSFLNTTFFVANGVDYEVLGGGTQDNPLLPDSNQDGIFTFNGVPTDAWFDPPSVDSFLFTMTDGHTFTHILDFPIGFESLFTVMVNGNILGQFGAGQEVDFAAFGFADGVNAFTISGIDPLVDAEDPEGFPIRLRFNAPFASFTMQGFGGNAAAAPEPGTIGFLSVGIGSFGIFTVRRRHS